MSFALAIMIDRMAVARVVLSTRRYSRPLAFIRGLTSSPKNDLWIWEYGRRQSAATPLGRVFVSDRTVGS